MTILLLVRHATTAATGHRLGGWTPGVHLDDGGRAQAAAVAERLAGLPVAAVHASPLERTQQTAAAIAAPHHLDVITEQGLGEVDYGDWTDRPLDELRREPAWATVQHTPSRMAFPGGGTIRGVQARAVDVTEQLAAAYPGKVVVAVSHADVIKAVLAHHLALPLDAFQRLVIDPASVSVVALPAHGHPLVLRVNDTGPLTLPEQPPAPDAADGDHATSAPAPPGGS